MASFEIYANCGVEGNRLISRHRRFDVAQRNFENLLPNYRRNIYMIETVKDEARLGGVRCTVIREGK